MRGISWLAENPSSSQECMCSMGLVGWFVSYVIVSYTNKNVVLYKTVLYSRTFISAANDVSNFVKSLLIPCSCLHPGSHSSFGSLTTLELSAPLLNSQHGSPQFVFFHRKCYDDSTRSGRMVERVAWMGEMISGQKLRLRDHLGKLEIDVSVV
jgi:hypothetical protein